MKKKLGKIFFSCLLFLLPFLVYSQDAPVNDAAGEQNKSAPMTKRQQRQKDRKEWKEHRKADIEEQKNIKEHHKRIQTKETRKRMRESKRKSTLINEHKREFFLKRWFKKKKRR